MVLKEMLVSMATVALSELGDKSHLITLLLSSKYKDHVRVFIGIMLGFLVTIVMAIIFGNFFSDFLLSDAAKYIVALSLIVFGIYTYLSHEDGPIKVSKHSPLVSSFLMILIAEMGDKSQLVSGFFGAKYNVFLITISLMAGLAIITYATIFIGRKFNKHIHPKVVHYVGGTLFILLGVFALVGVY